MPTYRGQTGWRHDDSKVQREFERVGRQIASIQNTTNNTTNVATATPARTATPDRVIRTVPDFQHGYISIDRLPDIQVPYNDIDTWKRENSAYTPEFGKYGWYVYNFIDHGWFLNDPNDFLLQLTDMHTIEMTDEEKADIPTYNYINSVYTVTHGINMQQRAVPEVEGITIDTGMNGYTKQIIMIRSVFKPHMFAYNGMPQATELEWIDEPNRRIRTNINFHYSLKRLT